MMEILIAALLQLAALRSPPPAAPLVFSSFVTAQDRLWSRRDVRDEANLPTFNEISAAADATEAQIRAEMISIDARLTSYHVVHRTGFRTGPEGGLAANGWFAGADLRKAELHEGGETWHHTATYYFAGNRPIARIEDAEQYAGTILSRYAPVASRTRDEIIFLEPERGWESDGEIIEDEVRMLRVLFRSASEEVAVPLDESGTSEPSRPGVVDRVLTWLSSRLNLRK
jgi:hypothetical protein